MSAVSWVGVGLSEPSWATMYVGQGPKCIEYISQHTNVAGKDCTQYRDLGQCS